MTMTQFDEPEVEMVYVGSTRPELYELKNRYRRKGANVVCSCGQIIHTEEGLFPHWQLGHFDKPIHKPWPEVVRAKRAQAEEP
jgi:hypothetical protein